MIPAAYAQLDLEALLNNLNIVRKYAPHSKVMAVIKANAYGHGLGRIAHAIESQVDAVAVARTDEGVRLRKAGFNRPITVLEGFVNRQELDEQLSFHLDTVVHMPEQIPMLQHVDASQVISVWLKMDTGMSRLGLRPEEFQSAYQALTRCRCLKQAPGLMTHLANADDREDNKTVNQIDVFRHTINGLSGECSIANSAAILGWQQSLAEWVRPGLMLYGCSPFPDLSATELGLKPVMGLHSRLIAVKQLRKGDTVGYGSSWQAPVDTRLGVIAVGYGDGYPRHISPQAPVRVNDRVVPLIGRVSMDMITVDLHGAPEAQIGDPVTLWGDGLPVEEIAKAAATIPYTLICGITQRVQIVES